MAARPERLSAARRWCGKVGYGSKAQAKQALKQLRERITIKRVYRCPLCTFWHLTSQA